MTISNVKCDEIIEDVKQLCDFLNDILETDSLSVAELVDALAFKGFRLENDHDDVMRDVFKKLVKREQSNLKKQAK